MAFFSSLSSSIGKKLLLYGLRQIDILDKDPTDFVSVDVGKRTTLEVRDVGLHVKKLVALLQLKLPPEVYLSRARAALLRVTFVLDFGVPQISIELDGIQVQARLVESAESGAHTPQHAPNQSRSRSSHRRHSASPPSTHDNYNEPSSDDDEHVPTVDELAKSFIRMEPAAEIRDLEQELGSRSTYMQESDVLSEAGFEEESSAGMGAPLALPTYLRNILNTALDRLTITVDDIGIEVEDRISDLGTDNSKSIEESPVTLHFHIERIAVDSLKAQDAPPEDPLAYPAPSPPRPSQRRLQVQNVCARLISDVENFVSMSRVSQPVSPGASRSDTFVQQAAAAETSHSVASVRSVEPTDSPSDPLSDEPPAQSQHLERSVQDLAISLRVEETHTNPATQHTPPIAASKPDIYEDVTPDQIMSAYAPPPLADSMHTVDEDRFADAISDDGITASYQGDKPTHSQHVVPSHGLDQSSILYDDEGLLDYAMQNDMLTSQFDHAEEFGIPMSDSHRSDQSRSGLYHSGPASAPASEASVSTLPTVSALGRSFKAPSSTQSPNQSLLSGEQLLHDPSPAQSVHTEEAFIAKIGESLMSMPLPAKDLGESQSSSQDDDESMYMSAISAAQSDSTDTKGLPGGWDSSSTSSKATSEQSGSIPEEMISGSILAPLPEVEESPATPRPNSPQSGISSLRETRSECSKQPSTTRRKQAKPFLSIDQIVVWFPLSLEEQQNLTSTETQALEVSGFDFRPPNLSDDSIFAEMPGSFSNYAQSSSYRRKSSTDDYSRRRATPSATKANTTSAHMNRTPSLSIKIEVGSVAGHMDLSTGRILFGMLNQVLSALTDPTSSTNKSSKPQEHSAKATSPVELTVDNVGIAWLENIAAESQVDGEAINNHLDLNPVDAILRTRMSVIRATSQSGPQTSRTKLQIGEFVLACLDQNIIAFQKSRSKSRHSISNIAEQQGHDVEIDYEQTTDKRITIVTRPVKVMLDVQKLDDALGCFGGFSGVLELSSSISSASAASSPIITSKPPRPRGVHFGDGTPVPAKASHHEATNAPKIQIQTGEVAFTLKGKACAVQVNTTSIRAALRAGNVRLKVSEIEISGPYVDATQNGSPLVVHIRGTTVNFLFAPEETDLARLISLITPSKDPYENNDDILIDTLLRQRRKGSVVRVEVSELGVRISDLEQLKILEALGAELARLSKVTKYLPDDDRPGLLSLASVKTLDARVAVNEQLGDVSIALQDAAVAHVGVPALLATEIGRVVITRGDEVLVHEVIPLRPQDQLPAIMLRMVGDEMEPIAKAKMFNVCIEYRVSTIMAALGLSEAATADDLALGIASSVATITGPVASKTLSRQSSDTSTLSSTTAKPLQVELLFRECAIGLNPRKMASKGLFVLTEAHLAVAPIKNEYSITLELRKASVHAIDDIARLEEEHDSNRVPAILGTNYHLQTLHQLGYVSLSSISAAKVHVNISGDGKDEPQLVDVEFKNELFVLESCADSTQTLIAILNGLQPPMPPSPAEKYRTVVPLQEMMDSFTGDAVPRDEDFADENFMNTADLVDDDVPTNMDFVGSMYNSQSLPTNEQMGDSLLDEDDLDALATPPLTRKRGERALLESFQEKCEISEAEQDFDFSENYFKDPAEDHEGKARKWDSTKNQYHLSNEFKVPDAPLKVCVRDMNIIWNLYDGYDWPRTRSIISQAVDDVEARAEERRRKARDEDRDDDFVEQDFLFNSVWIGVDAKDEKGELIRRINHDIDDLASETGSYATSTATRSTVATSRTRSATKPRRRLKLQRSRHKKMAFSVMGVKVDLVVFPPNTGETINSIDVGIRDLEIFDHMHTSTWKKFITCQIDPTERELKRPMVNLQLLTVKPVTDLAASELVIKVIVLPLRLHVDQDALEFITRFFEFKDDAEPEPPSGGEQPFIQRLEVMAVQMKLDYKPKRIDYGGLLSGHTTELKNFATLDGADIVLRHAIVYGITSFDKLHKTLNDVWVPDVVSNQLRHVLPGLAMVRPIINVGSGIRDLVVVPMREYKKDGRIVRSLQKGVFAFAKNTTSEVARLGAKVAIGTQTILEGAETFLSPQTGTPTRQSHHDWDGEDPSSDTEEPQAVSHYANQPLGVRAGLRSAARHLERDLLTARDAVIAIPAEVMEQGSGVGVARALARHAPTVVLRPALGATKALSNALLGVGNALDSSSKRKIEDKYKSY